MEDEDMTTTEKRTQHDEQADADAERLWSAFRAAIAAAREVVQ